MNSVRLAALEVSMTVDQLINALVTLTLIEMMVATGLGVSLVDLTRVAANGRLVVRTVLANYVCVPLATIALLRLFDPHPMVSAGFLILAVCPGAPYGPPFTAIAKGNVTVSVGLMVLLAGSSAILAPILLSYLLRMVPGSESLQVNAAKIAIVLLVTQLLPICVGVAIRQLRPTLADRLQTPANLASKILNLVAVGLVLATKYPLLTEIQLRGFAGMMVLLMISWFAGWLLGRPSADIRRALAVTTSLRNVSVGLVIATSDFAGTPAIMAVVAYGLVSLFGTLSLATWVGKTGPASNQNRAEQGEHGST